jgi:hypothetical protein
MGGRYSILRREYYPKSLKRYEKVEKEIKI